MFLSNFCFSNLMKTRKDFYGTKFHLMLSTVTSGFHGVPVEKVLSTLYLSSNETKLGSTSENNEKKKPRHCVTVDVTR